MFSFSKKPIVVTHSGSFHADDVFAVAALSLVLDGRIKVVRTRDNEVIARAQYVVDVGGQYDPNNHRYDHHQEGGAGQRENGVSYAAFGLVWRHFGEAISGSQEAGYLVDKSLVQFLDVMDNGAGFVKPVLADVMAYSIKDAVQEFNPSWDEFDTDADSAFLAAVQFAKGVLEREVGNANALIRCRNVLARAYNEAVDKRIIVLDNDYPWEDVLNKYPEPLFVIVPKSDNGRVTAWRVGAVRDDAGSFKNRKDFPVAWAGKRDKELAAITGVEDAIYCANQRFVAYSRSKEGAVKLAGLAAGLI